MAFESARMAPCVFAKSFWANPLAGTVFFGGNGWCLILRIFIDDTNCYHSSIILLVGLRANLNQIIGRNAADADPDGIRSGIFGCRHHAWHRPGTGDAGKSTSGCGISGPVARSIRTTAYFGRLIRSRGREGGSYRKGRI